MTEKTKTEAKSTWSKPNSTSTGSRRRATARVRERQVIEGSYAGGTAYSGDNDRPGLENGRAAASASLSPPTPFLEIGGDRVAEPGQEVMTFWSQRAPGDPGRTHHLAFLAPRLPHRCPIRLLISLTTSFSQGAKRPSRPAGDCTYRRSLNRYNPPGEAAAALIMFVSHKKNTPRRNSGAQKGVCWPIISCYRPVGLMLELRIPGKRDPVPSYHKRWKQFGCSR